MAAQKTNLVLVFLFLSLFNLDVALADHRESVLAISAATIEAMEEDLSSVSPEVRTPMNPSFYLSPLSALGANGPLGPNGAHGLRRDMVGNYVHNGQIYRKANVPTMIGNQRSLSTRSFELYEMYTEEHARQMRDNDTSFMVEGEFSEGDFADGYSFTSDVDQFVTIVVVPEKSLDTFALTDARTHGTGSLTRREQVPLPTFLECASFPLLAHHPNAIALTSIYAPS